ncbi:hypothetical protein CDAR_22991 [Caerostris darwini]|uniref:Uncharacterized protein n=1 Tax=Caerostris darwini TaxID=1538125 RepID=A0AAV4WFK2_9ARAC|nr:hypothetical protein CDAR_22991 [Caerostris darwini]
MSLDIKPLCQISEFLLTIRTTFNHITADIDNFTSKSLKDLSDDKKWKCLSTGCRGAVLQPAITTCRHNSTIGLVSDGICPLCCSSNMNMRNCIEPDVMTLHHATGRLVVVRLNNHRWA